MLEAKQLRVRTRFGLCKQSQLYIGGRVRLWSCNLQIFLIFQLNPFFLNHDFSLYQIGLHIRWGIDHMRANIVTGSIWQCVHITSQLFEWPRLLNIGHVRGRLLVRYGRQVFNNKRLCQFANVSIRWHMRLQCKTFLFQSYFKFYWL